MKKIFYIATSALLLASCETAFDTYSEYVDVHGKEMYPNSSADLTTELGWERFILSWDNGSDVSLTKNIVVWTINPGTDAEVKDSVEIDININKFDSEADASGYDFPITGGAKIEIYTENSQGVRSNPLTYTTPELYHLNHSEVVGQPATTVTGSIYSDNGNGSSVVLVYLAAKESNVTATSILYTAADGSAAEYNVVDSDFAAGYVRLAVDSGTEGNIAAAKSFTLANCIDAISLTGENAENISISEYVYNNNYDINNSPKFKADVLVSNSVSEADLANFVATTKELKLSGDIATIKDVAHFPMLEKVIIGSRIHYLSSSFAGFTLDDAAGDAAYIKSAILLGLAKDIKFDIHYNMYDVASHLGNLVEGDYSKASPLPTILSPGYIKPANWMDDPAMAWSATTPGYQFDYYSMYYLFAYDTDYNIIENGGFEEIRPVSNNEKFQLEIDFNAAVKLNGVAVRQLSWSNRPAIQKMSLKYALESDPNTWIELPNGELNFYGEYETISFSDLPTSIENVHAVLVELMPEIVNTPYGWPSVPTDVYVFSIDDLMFY